MNKFSLLILCAGFGKRMLELTRNIPKPLLKIKGKPMIEIIINKAKACGISNIYISINH